ncbi:N-terminal glutamine amidase-domain-containing protein [Lenzites betulinus]|nr:N-terminal glutamine amidase-domain-containing protein [Lenzites betulinus]
MSSPFLTAPGPGRDTSPPPLPPDSVYTSCYCEENIYLLAQAFIQLSDAHSTGDRGSWPWQIYVVFISNGAKTVALWSQKAARDDVIVWDYHVVLVLLPRGAPPDSRGETHRSPAAEDDSQGRPVREAWVYDFDTTLPVPCHWRAYIAGTFPYALDGATGIDKRYESLFRVTPAREYLDHFASDRSHMIVPALADSEGPLVAEDGSRLGGTDGEDPQGSEDAPAAPGPRYASPPPPYPPLQGAQARAMGIAHNLMEAFVAMGVPPPASPGPLAGEFVGGAAQHGQVMGADAFVRWLAGSSKAAW